jgi:hypothetical protein
MKIVKTHFIPDPEHDHQGNHQAKSQTQDIQSIVNFVPEKKTEGDLNMV